MTHYNIYEEELTTSELDHTELSKQGAFEVFEAFGVREFKVRKSLATQMKLTE